MKNKMTPKKLASLAVMVAVLSPLAANAAGAPTGDFAESSLQGWDERSFEGNTEYKLIEQDGKKVLHGYTDGQASILFREKKVDLNKTPIIKWSWKIDKTFDNIDEKKRSGDDFPARLYVAAKTGFLPWDTIAINYVWSSQNPLEQSWANPFTDKAIMVPVQTGDELVGQWAVQSRNIKEDFKKLFNRDVDEISGYAVMVDGDNSKQQANAWFGNIDFTKALE